MGPVAIIVGVISAIASVVGGVMSYQSNQQQAKAAKAQGEAMSMAAAENARAAKAAAAYEEYQQRYRTSKMIGEQRSKFGKAGVIMEGTPLTIMEDTAYQSELDAMAIKFKGDTAYNRGMAEASSYQQSGDRMATAYSNQAGTSLLTGFVSGMGQAVGAFDSYKGWKSKGGGWGLS